MIVSYWFVESKQQVMGKRNDLFLLNKDEFHPVVERSELNSLSADQTNGPGR